MSEWKTIETAPKDGTEILIWSSGQLVLLARWIAPIDFLTDSEADALSGDDLESDGWFAADFIQGCRLDWDPTHWQPLLPPPETQGETR